MAVSRPLDRHVAIVVRAPSGIGSRIAVPTLAAAAQGQAPS